MFYYTSVKKMLIECHHLTNQKYILTIIVSVIVFNIKQIQSTNLYNEAKPMPVHPSLAPTR